MVSAAELERLVAATRISAVELMDLSSRAGLGLFVGLQIKLLANELVRLRGDEWLRAAAEEYLGAEAEPEGIDTFLEVLRRHRDGVVEPRPGPKRYAQQGPVTR